MTRVWQAAQPGAKCMPDGAVCLCGSGTFELQVVAQDLESFSRFALGSLMKLPNVKDLHTSFSLGEVKSAGALPLSHLGARRPATESAPSPAKTTTLRPRAGQ